MKDLVLKEMGRLSLRYAEEYSSILLHEGIPKSTLSYWKINHGVRMVLSVLFSILRLIRYDCNVLDLTKFTDWYKDLHEAFLRIR